MNLKNYWNFIQIDQLLIFCLRGFKYGFKLNYTGPRSSCAYDNLLAIKQNPDVATKQLINEIELGRMAGPFKNKPISNLRCSPVRVVPKRTGDVRLITHLSYHKENSVNDFIDERFTKVNYSSFDNIVNLVKR